MLLKKPVPRRTVLRGLIGGMGVGVALPFLDCFLNENGTALASGDPLPLRFGTWYWGCGLTPGQAVTERTASGPGIEFLTECAPLRPYAKQINFFSAFNTPLDGMSNYVHHSGWVASRTGMAPAVTGEIPGTTFDLLIADALGGGTRFRNLDLVSMGNPKISYSARSTYSRSAAEASPLGLYARVFGTSFADPKKADFTPDPRLMARRSVLSAVAEESKKLQSQIGHADQAKLDEYFTSIRELENQLDVQLRKPEVGAACAVPAWVDPDSSDASHDLAAASYLEVETVAKTHELLTSILVMALACNQTRIFNMVYSDAFSGLHKAGDSNTHHTLTHEEETDPKLGYQPQAFWFNCRNMIGCAAFIEAFSKVREGDRTLLDNTLIFASSETSYARMHQINNLPMMTFGSGGGRIKTGIHVIGNGDPVTRVGLTVMRALGLPIDHWGTGALGTSKLVTEIMV
jgi:hypothetical protein